MYIITIECQFQSQHPLHHNCTNSKEFIIFHSNIITIQYLCMRKEFSKLNTYISKNVKFKTLNRTHIQIHIFPLAHDKSRLIGTQKCLLSWPVLCWTLLSRNVRHSNCTGTLRMFCTFVRQGWEIKLISTIILASRGQFSTM